MDTGYGSATKRGRMETDKLDITLGAASWALLAGTLSLGLFVAPVDMHQGEVYRIIYLHVPAAMTAFLISLIMCVYGVRALLSPSEDLLRKQRACAEVGLIFTVLTLATGSIWGKPTWGTWWTWDARLTTTFLLALLYCGFLLLHASLVPGLNRIKVGSVLSIVIFADVPVIYVSVYQFRTLHQPPSLMRPGGSTMSPEIKNILIACIVSTLLLGLWLIWQRSKNLKLSDRLEDESYEQLRKSA